MGFIRGVIVGIAAAAGAAAWYMSRAGSRFRDRYRVDRRLGEFGDEGCPGEGIGPDERGPLGGDG